MRCPICHPDDPKGPTGELLAWARRVGEQRADYDMYATYSTARLRLQGGPAFAADTIVGERAPRGGGVSVFPDSRRATRR